jgi:hypothetical protein
MQLRGEKRSNFFQKIFEAVPELTRFVGLYIVKTKIPKQKPHRYE